MTIPMLALLLASGALAAGCDDEIESGVDDSPCDLLAVSPCAVSRACADDCRISFPSGGTQGSGNEILFENLHLRYPAEPGFSSRADVMSLYPFRAMPVDRAAREIVNGVERNKASSW